MPLNQTQVDNITSTIQEANGLLNGIINSREDLLALIRINADVTDDGATSVIASSRLRAKTAAETLVTLFS